MKLFIVLLSLLAVAVATYITDKEWAEYKKKFKKEYSGYEDTTRRLNLLNNKIYINLHNLRAASNLVTYRLEVNQFSDMSRIQFFQMLGGQNYAANEPPPPRRETPPKLGKFIQELPPFRNWTQDGAGYGVYDQGTKCNAAWAFAAIEGIEAHYYQLHAILPPKLSAQNLIDCAGGSRGCSGLQIPETAYDYISFHGNVNTESTYPYTGLQTFCKYRDDDIGCTIGDYQTINDDDDGSLMTILAWETPVVVGFNPFSFEFMHYSSGIFIPPRNTVNIYHKFFMTVVGYGNVNNTDYWILKNSMGYTWGESGYMRIIRNSDYPIAKHASFANL